MELTEQQQRVISLVLNKQCVIVHGKAGSGKSTVIRQLKNLLQEQGITYLVTAPFGVAAANVSGSTLHSAFGIKTLSFLSENFMPNSISNEILSTQVFIIDEMSTIRPDVMDYILRMTSGKTLVLFGDLEQAQPVISEEEFVMFEECDYDMDKMPYFYAAKGMEDRMFEEVYLDKIHRQREQAFLDGLNEVREKKKLTPFFDQFKTNVLPSWEECGTIICYTNQQVNAYNKLYLNELEGQEIVLSAEYLSDLFEQKDYLCESVAVMKHGCQIMMMMNDTNGRYVNGTIGTFLEGTEWTETKVIGKAVELPLGATKCYDNGDLYSYTVRHLNHHVRIGDNVLELSPVLFSKHKTLLDGKIGRYTYVSSMIQFPVRVCKAITSHKCQGLEFPKVTVDMKRRITGNNLYVALSRCTEMGGLKILV